MDKPLEVLVGEILLQHELWLATAESCTGGLISHLITNVAGSSAYYLGGVTAYANETKVRLLGVNPETLELHGAVSEQTVLEMARGIRYTLAADIGLSVSGIAGPAGGTPEKPVGTVWIGLSAASEKIARHYLWSGSRSLIKEQAAQAGLQLLLEHLQKVYK